MARDAQAITIGQTTSPDNTAVDYIPLAGGGRGIWPSVRCVHRGSFAINGSGVGDTADLRITLPLPSNVVWQLDQFAFVTEDTNEYDAGVFELYIAPSSTEFGDSTQITYPMFRGIQTDPAGLGNDYQNWQFGVAAPIRPNSGGWMNGAVNNLDPFRVITFNDESGGADPVIWIGSVTNTDIQSGTGRLYVSWLGYTFEQMDSAELWTGLNQRG